MNNLHTFAINFVIPQDEVAERDALLLLGDFLQELVNKAREDGIDVFKDWIEIHDDRGPVELPSFMEDEALEEVDSEPIFPALRKAILQRNIARD